MSTKKRLANNLVVMGSAAVMAVYAAGYVRTAAAAEKFAEMSDDRGALPARKSVTSDAKAAPVAMTSRANRAGNGESSEVGGSAASTSSSNSAGQLNTTAGSNSIDRQKNGSASATGRAPTSMPARTMTPPAPVANNTARTVQTGVATSGTQPVTQNANAAPNAQALLPTPKQTVVASAAPIPAPTVPVPTVVIPTATAAVPTPSPGVAVTAPITSSSSVTPVSPEAPVKSAPTVPDSKPPLPPGVKYRDGEYYGWGTSRHGDIQAYVEVTDGKVSYVKIAQCLTQYSCGLIDVLPGQVFTRNGPEIDSVSGATQSSNAFFYAVQQALSKAK